MKLDMPQRKTRLGEILKKTDFWGFSTASLSSILILISESLE